MLDPEAAAIGSFVISKKFLLLQIASAFFNMDGFGSTGVKSIKN